MDVEPVCPAVTESDVQCIGCGAPVARRCTECGHGSECCHCECVLLAAESPPRAKTRRLLPHEMYRVPPLAGSVRGPPVPLDFGVMPLDLGVGWHQETHLEPSCASTRRARQHPAPAMPAADDYGDFAPAAVMAPLPSDFGFDMAYDMVVPPEAAREVTPPRMRVRGAQHGRLLSAYERAFNEAATQERPLPHAEAEESPVFTDASHVEIAGGARRRIILDERGAEIQWPWEAPCPVAPPPAGALACGGSGEDIVAQYFAKAGPQHDRMGTHKADATVQAGLNAATADGASGENSSGVRAYKMFCHKYKRAPMRPIDPNAPLWVKLSEEQWGMRFIAEIIDDRTVLPSTGRSYFGAANRWHLRKTGIGFAAGMDMQRLAEMMKGLKKLHDGPPGQMRRGISPQQLRAGMDAVYPPTSAENVNIRAMLATGLQALMRGRELGCEGAFSNELDLARGDIATSTKDRLAFFMRPAKNMKHRRGKTVPIVIGGGGEFVDACMEVMRMLEMDPSPRGQEAGTPMFRKPNGSAFTTDDIRAIVRQLCFAIGEEPLLFGAHSLRIGGATALFAAGADPIHIRTMGRWSSDCYRLYVRACFEQTMAWTRKLGSQRVHDVQGTYERSAQETEEY